MIHEELHVCGYVCFNFSMFPHHEYGSAAGCVVSVEQQCSETLFTLYMYLVLERRINITIGNNVKGRVKASVKGVESKLVQLSEYIPHHYHSGF